ncbi:hypothetical protein [Herbaspirillum sp. alder98]|uniref:hypothetical protein n=1 Tax=Herbaspirillum sp. alder98 TaxID=2913096 RepID=UPI001CD89C16|nr:hypothetical protein [Herbaspirillum sp. alder98]MCA1326285.1 hypothetical protein [Herbaspirillum sp. alder98]
MTIPGKTLLGTACATLALLTGCAGGVPPYVEPPVATVAVKDSEARIVMRSAGMPMAVNYAMSTSESTCEGFAPVGRVFHSGREQLLPWIATLTEKSRSAVSNDQPQVEQVVPANRRVQVKAYSGWSDVTAQMRSSGSCGPLTSQFTPAGGKTYLVEFRFAGTRDCSQTVYEIDAAEQRLPVEQRTALYCSR